VLAADTHNDVALLQTDARNLPALPMARSIGVGATVYCLSHPALNCEGTLNGFYTFTKGIVSGKFSMRLEGPSPVNVVAITADYAQGSSGGPILNEHGAVVGIVCQTKSLCSDPNTEETQMTWKLARPASSILALVGQAGPAH
jgi:S1-C subfamily serine protease